jgi:hypothetical protein
VSTKVRDELLGLSGSAWTRLHERMRGLDDAEYRWEPAEACWTIRRRPDGTTKPDGIDPWPAVWPDPAPITTIAWRVAHITDILAQERNALWLGLEPVVSDDFTAEPTASGAIERLERANGIWEGYLRSVDDTSLWERVGPVGEFFADATRVAFVLHEIDELIHHGAAVALLRDLYRTRDA